MLQTYLTAKSNAERNIRGVKAIEGLIDGHKIDQEIVRIFSILKIYKINEHRSIW